MPDSAKHESKQLQPVVTVKDARPPLTFPAAGPSTLLSFDIATKQPNLEMWWLMTRNASSIRLAPDTVLEATAMLLWPLWPKRRACLDIPAPDIPAAWPSPFPDFQTHHFQTQMKATRQPTLGMWYPLTSKSFSALRMRMPTTGTSRMVSRTCSISRSLCQDNDHSRCLSVSTRISLMVCAPAVITNSTAQPRVSSLHCCLCVGCDLQVTAKHNRQCKQAHRPRTMSKACRRLHQVSAKRTTASV